MTIREAIEAWDIGQPVTVTGQVVEDRGVRKSEYGFSQIFKIKDEERSLWCFCDIESNKAIVQTNQWIEATGTMREPKDYVKSKSYSISVPKGGVKSLDGENPTEPSGTAKANYSEERAKAEERRQLIICRENAVGNVCNLLAPRMVHEELDKILKLVPHIPSLAEFFVQYYQSQAITEVAKAEEWLKEMARPVDDDIPF